MRYDMNELKEILDEKKVNYEQILQRKHEIGLKKAELETQKKNSSNKSRVVEGIDQFRKREGIDGIYGSLRSLGKIERAPGS